MSLFSDSVGMDQSKHFLEELKDHFDSDPLSITNPQIAAYLEHGIHEELEKISIWELKQHAGLILINWPHDYHMSRIREYLTYEIGRRELQEYLNPPPID